MATSITGWTAATWHAKRNVKKKKGCDLGYALAINSREGAGSMDTYTVAALMRSPLLRFQTPTAPQSPSFFRVWWLDGLLHQADHPAYFRSPDFAQINLFQPSNIILVENFRSNSCAADRPLQRLNGEGNQWQNFPGVATRSSDGGSSQRAVLEAQSGSSASTSTKLPRRAKIR
jgi:hypothetical protein